MCEVTVVKYVHPDGKKETVEKKRLCGRSDGQNPCIYYNRREVTEMVPPGTPSLVYEDASPMSASIPGTPITVTAPNYEIREPLGLHRSSSKGKGKAKPVHISFGSKTKKSTSPKRKQPSKYYEDDDDPIVAIEDRGKLEPRSSARPPPPPLGSPISPRLRRQPAVVNQPHPPSPRDEATRPATHPSYHRRTFTAPESISFNPDNEIRDRADARDELRRQNRERQRHEDEEKRRQREEDARKLAREQQKREERERREQAEDEYSVKEYQRLQEKERARDEARRRREADKERQEEQAREQEEVERISKELDERREKERRRKQVEEAFRLSEQSRRDEERMKREEESSERAIKDEIERHRCEQLAATAKDLRNIQAQIGNLEHMLHQSQERRAARDRAERLQDEIRQHNLLRAEIEQLEEEKRRDTIESNESEVLRLEAEYHRLSGRIRDRESGGSIGHSPIDGPRFNERRNIAMGPPRSPVDVLQRRSPFQNEEYRRAIGEQVLQRERSRAAANDFQSVVGSPGVSRRNTVGGANRTREQHYRWLRKNYPE